MACLLPVAGGPDLLANGHWGGGYHGMWSETGFTKSWGAENWDLLKWILAIILIAVIWVQFLSLVWSKLRLCSANHRAGYFSNLACDWLNIVWASSEQETENGPWLSPYFLSPECIISFYVRATHIATRFWIWAPEWFVNWACFTQ